MKIFERPEWKELGEEFFTGKIGSREAYRRALSIFRINRERLLELIDGEMDIDRGFVKFWEHIKNRGWDFIIVSDGFKLYIERVLGRYGVIPDRIFANEVIFDEKGELTDVVFPYEDAELCRMFATCKIKILESLKESYSHIFYFGDGVTDYDVADRVTFLFAKERLAHYAADNSIPFFRFENFERVGRILENPVKWIVFDLDGVLIDSEAAILHAINEVRNAEGLPSLGIEAIREYIGLPLNEFIERLTGRFKEDHIGIFREAFGKVYLERTRLLDGARQLLEYLHGRGYGLGVVTNKKGEYARNLMKHLGVDTYFDFVLGEETDLPQKPRGELWDYIASQKGLELDRTIYVGDAKVDRDFAKSRNVLFAGITATGVSASDFLRLEADMILNDVTDLKRVF